LRTIRNALMIGVIAASTVVHGACAQSVRNELKASGEVQIALSPTTVPAPCPANELSCGLQTPVVSDGVLPFENHDMEIRAIFPAGSRVCLGRSGDEPRGFYAWYGTDETGCPERGDISARFMGISSSFNALSYVSLRQVAGRCRSPTGAISRQLRSVPLAIPGRRSLTGQTKGRRGEIEITVYAMAGTPSYQEPKAAPRTIYFATLGTLPERLVEDTRRFQVFLRDLRLGEGQGL
jgi:hypothetical protein